MPPIRTRAEVKEVKEAKEVKVPLTYRKEKKERKEMDILIGAWVLPRAGAGARTVRALVCVLATISIPSEGGEGGDGDG